MAPVISSSGGGGSGVGSSIMTNASGGGAAQGSIDPLIHYATLAGLFPPGTRERIELEAQERDFRDRSVLTSTLEIGQSITEALELK